MLLYFLITDFASVDHMYQFSLSWFLDLFVATLNNAPGKYDFLAASQLNSQVGQTLAERTFALVEHFTYSVYQSVCSSIFDKHKLLFSFLMCVKLMEMDIDQNEWKFLVHGYDTKVSAQTSLMINLFYFKNIRGKKFTTNNLSKHQSKVEFMLKPAWMADSCWLYLTDLNKLPAFDGLILSIRGEPGNLSVSISSR